MNNREGKKGVPFVTDEGKLEGMSKRVLNDANE